MNPPIRLLACTAMLVGTAAHAAAIFTCVDAQGRRHTSDRLIAECAGLPQIIKNPDGSTRTVVPPPATEEERAAAEAAARAQAKADSERRSKERADLALVRKYPSPEAHAAARAKELEDVKESIKGLQKRTAALAVERKRLASEEEFYAGRPLPPKLKTAIEATEAQMSAQRALMEERTAELSRVNAKFDVQLADLQTLWAARR